MNNGCRSGRNSQIKTGLKDWKNRLIEWEEAREETSLVDTNGKNLDTALLTSTPDADDERASWFLLRALFIKSTEREK